MVAVAPKETNPGEPARPRHAAQVHIITPIGHLPMVLRPEVPLTNDELFEFCSINRDLRIERTETGELLIRPPTGGETGRRNFTLTVLFGSWVARDGTGVGFDSSTGFILPNGAERSPDVAWVKRARWEALTPEQKERFAPLCPDFVIELRSPSDRLERVKAKMEEYIANGASLGWLLDLEEQKAYIYRPGIPAECLTNPGEISGEPLLQGFVLRLDAIR